MAIYWRLRTHLATQHGIFTATALQELIVKKTGILVSLVNLCRYLRKKPRQLRLETAELLCTALGCQLSAFCQIEPRRSRPGRTKKLGPENTPKVKRGLKAFPDPANYDD
jgi:DNA-binding Xre family transcriptional regulator